MALTPPQYKQMKQFLESDQRNKKTALLQDDLEPGPLKDELKGTFDPTQETYEEYLRRINLADGGMLVKPGFGGVRQGYREPRFPKGKGIQLSNEQIQLLKDNLTKEEFKQLKFGRPLKADAIDFGVRQRDNQPLFRKVVNILEPGKAGTAVKIINNEKLSNALIKSANAGDDIQTIVKKMNKLDKSLSRNQIGSAINALVARGQIKEEFGRARGTKISVGEQRAYNKIIEKEVNEGKLNRAQIARKAGVTDGTVQDWIVNNKGQQFYDENYTYEKGRLKTGTLQKQKDLFNYIEKVDNISAAEVEKIFKMRSGKETQELMSDLISVIYRMRGNTKTGSIIVPYDDEGRMREVLRKIRNAPDFEDIYQRRIGDLVRDAYPKGPKRVQALKSLGQYWEFSRALKEVAPELALNLDHVVPFGFLEEVKQGKNPINLIKVKPIPAAVNRFKANFDSARINLNRELRLNPTNRNTLKKFKILRELEGLTKIEFGGVSAKGNVYDFKAKPIGQSDLIKDAVEGIKTYDKIGKFSQQVLEDKSLQKKFIEAGVDVGKDFSIFKNIQPISEETKIKVKNLIATLSKDPRCQIRGLKNQGGWVGFQDGSANLEICFRGGIDNINRGLPNPTAAQARNFGRVAALGRNVVKFGILPEALFLAGESVIRMGMGDTLPEAILRASEYLLPGNQTKLADRMMLARTVGPKSAELILKANELRGFENRIENLENEKQFTGILTDDGFDDNFFGQTKVEEENAIQKQIDALKKRKKSYGSLTESQFQFADARAQEAEDIKTSKALFPKFLAKARSVDIASDDPLAEGIKKTMDLDLKMLPSRFQRSTDLEVRQPKFDILVNTPKQQLSDLFKGQELENILEDKKLIEGYRAQTVSEAAAESPEYMFGPSMTFFGEPLGKVAQPQIDTITGMESEILGQTNLNERGEVINPFDIDRANIATGLRGFSAAGGGIAKLAGKPSGPPPTSGPTSQGLQGLMKRVKRI